MTEPTTSFTPVPILYVNHRGEVAVRRIVPGPLWFGSTEWHREPQWLMTADEPDTGKRRDFALAGIKTWGAAAVDDVPAPSTHHGNASSKRPDVDMPAAPTASGSVGRTVSAGARDDVKCRCVGTFGPNPDCGACGGSGCVSDFGDLGEPQAAQRNRSAMMRLFASPAALAPGGDR